MLEQKQNDLIGLLEKLAASQKHLSKQEQAFVLACANQNAKFRSLVSKVQLEEPYGIPQVVTEKKSLKPCRYWLLKAFRHFADSWRFR